jgi:hypothetical protein
VYRQGFVIQIAGATALQPRAPRFVERTAVFVSTPAHGGGVGQVLVSVYRCIVSVYCSSCGRDS